MNAFLVYMLKSAVYLAAFYPVYSILLSRDTSYGRNRGFILISFAAALLLPLITMNTGELGKTGIFGRWLSEVLINSSNPYESETSSFINISGLRIVNLIYFAGVTIFLAKFILDLANLVFLILRQRNAGSKIIRFHAFTTAGFSAMGYIFVNSGLSSEEEAEIIKHEKNHLYKNHFIDIIFTELVKSFQWFNPAIYLFNRSLRAVHEYQADHECLKSGVTVSGYQTLLLKQVFRSVSLNLSNSFSNPSLVRRRMIMMTRKRTPAMASIKLLFVLPVAGLVFMLVSAYGQNTHSAPVMNSPEITLQNSDNTEKEPYFQVDEMPVYPGGDEALLKYLVTNTRYPENAKNKGIQGRVLVRFCVTEKGSITKISVLQGADPELDAEAIRVTGTLPHFTPGKLNGKAVPVWYMVPLTFTLK
jgi:TonB family protein